MHPTHGSRHPTPLSPWVTLPACLQARLARAALPWVLALAFNAPRVWVAPLDSARHWATLSAGHKMLIYHRADRVIGRAGLVYALDEAGRQATNVIELRGRPSDAHNDDPASFSPKEWAAAVHWMRERLQLDQAVAGSRRRKSE